MVPSLCRYSAICALLTSFDWISRKIGRRFTAKQVVRELGLDEDSENEDLDDELSDFEPEVNGIV